MNDRSRLDHFWDGSPRARILVAVAIYLVGEELGIKPSQIVSAANKVGRSAVDAKLVSRKAVKGKAYIADGFQNVADAGQFLASPPRATPLSKFSFLAQALVSLVGDPAPNAASFLLRSIVDNLRLTLADIAGNDAIEEAESQFRSGSAKRQPSDPGPSNPLADQRVSQARTAMAFVAAEAGIDEDDFRKVYATFSGRTKTPAPEMHYLCYRFHSNGENIVKTFMAIKAPSDTLPLSLFTNVSIEPEGDDPRIASGVIIPGDNRIYFLATIRGGAALKVIVLLKPPAKKASFVGLTMSVEEDGRPVVARILFKKTEATRHDDGIEIGHIPIERIRAEIGNADLDKIRNRIKFKLEEGSPIFMHGKPLTSAQLVMEVQKALRDEGNRPLFSDTHHNEFNPADDVHYTYNAGLPIWVAGEKD